MKKDEQLNIEIAFGDYYKGLGDKRGDKPHNLKSPSSRLTVISGKQQAEEDIQLKLFDIPLEKDDHDEKKDSF